MSHLIVNGVDKTLDHIRLNNVRSEQLLNCTIEQGTINSIGQLANHQNRVRTSDFVQLAAGIYTISMQNADQYAGFYFIYDAATEMFVERLPSDWAHFPLTFTLQSAQKVKFVFRFTDASPITPSDISSVMLNAGSTAKPYVPYLITKEAWEARDKNDHLLWGRADTFTGTNSISVRCYGLPVKSWEIDGNSQQTGTPAPDNPVDPEFVGERTANLFPATTDWYRNNNSDPSLKADTMDTRIKSDIVPISGDGETISAATFKMPDIPGFALISLRFFDSAKTQISSGLPPIAIPTGAKFISLLYGAAGGITDATKSQMQAAQIMVVYGNSAPTAYEPYGYKLPITSANQTVPVYLGQVQTVRRVKKLVLTGSADETWTKANTAGGDRAFFEFSSGDRVAGQGENISTHFQTASIISASSDIGAMILTNGVLRVRPEGAGSTEISAWKIWLAAQYANGTPVVVWYVLATPTTGIVNEPLAKIGTYADTLTSEQAGITIQTTDGNTTISVDTTLAPSKFEIKVHAKPI